MSHLVFRPDLETKIVYFFEVVLTTYLFAGYVIVFFLFSMIPVDRLHSDRVVCD